MSPLLSEVKLAIEQRGHTRYRIAKEAGVAQSQLSRLVHGQRGLRVETVERLALYLGYEVALVKRRRSSGR